MKFKPIITKEELDALSINEVVQGYRDGLANVALCSEVLTRAYLHGWNNGQVDGGYSPMSVEQMTLARVCMAKGLIDA